MNVVMFEAEQREQEACFRLEPDNVVTCTRERLTRATVARHADAEIVSPFVNSRLDAVLLAQLPHLKLIATRSTGFDHIDLEYCHAHGVTVCNVPNYGDHTVAEHVFALLLALSRHLVEAVERTRRGNFSQSGLRGVDLHGKILGVIGTGRIGRRVIEIARGFGMDVVALDIRPDERRRNALASATHRLMPFSLRPI